MEKSDSYNGYIVTGNRNRDAASIQAGDIYSKGQLKECEKVPDQTTYQRDPEGAYRIV